jgi:hypothetical protein
VVVCTIKNETGFQELGQNRPVYWNVILEPRMSNVVEATFDISFQNPLA